MHDGVGESGTLLEMRGICKRFPGVAALTDVSFDLRGGEVHALVGENGAGKSTLIKTLAGAHEPDAGEIVVGGRSYAHLTPDEARRLGISVIYQEFNLVPELQIAENIFLGDWPRTRFGLVDSNVLRRKAEALLASLGLRIDVTRPVWSLTIAEQQIVEIAKALALDARLLVMDEPSAVIGGDELEQLFAVIESLRGRGVGVVYISHRLEEVFRIADRVTVLKDGHVVGTKPVGETDRDEVIRMMVGRELSDEFALRTRALEPSEPILSVRGLTAGGGFLRGVTFDLHAGEILGVAGLIGSGRTTLGLAVFGVERLEAGEIVVGGRPGQPSGPIAAIRSGVVLIPEDRKGQGLLLGETVRFNLSLPSLDSLKRAGLLLRRREARLAATAIERLAIRPPRGEGRVELLSGGNQQKVVIGKWLAAEPRVIVMDEPTRGVDVGGKVEIYRRMRELADGGAGILMISSELPEILAMSDRVLVLREGVQTGILDRAEASEEAVMRLAVEHGEAAA